jgi:hypothetical protein
LRADSAGTVCRVLLGKNYEEKLVSAIAHRVGEHGTARLNFELMFSIVIATLQSLRKQPDHSGRWWISKSTVLRVGAPRQFSHARAKGGARRQPRGQLYAISRSVICAISPSGVARRLRRIVRCTKRRVQGWNCGRHRTERTARTTCE